MPPDPISQNEKTNVLQRLNQIIQHRLVTSKLPSQLSNLSIGKLIKGGGPLRSPARLPGPTNLSPNPVTIRYLPINLNLLEGRAQPSRAHYNGCSCEQKTAEVSVKSVLTVRAISDLFISKGSFVVS